MFSALYPLTAHQLIMDEDPTPTSVQMTEEMRLDEGIPEVVEKRNSKQKHKKQSKRNGKYTDISRAKHGAAKYVANCVKNGLLNGATTGEIDVIVATGRGIIETLESAETMLKDLRHAVDNARYT